MSSSGLDNILQKRVAADGYSPLRQRYIQSPSLPFFLLSTAYHALREVPLTFKPQTPSDAAKIRLVCISDTHNQLLPPSEVPQGDILVHAGDLTQSGSAQELQRTLDWLRSFPHPYKVLIGGNHDAGLGQDDVRATLDLSGLTYLCDATVDISVRGRSVRIHGSPWTPQHGNFAFQYPRGGVRAKAQWAGLEPGLDVLVTHGPPKGHVDHAGYGCDALLDAAWRVKPKVMVCGHVHAGRGLEILEWDEAQKMWESVVQAPNRLSWWGMVTGVWQLWHSWLRGFRKERRDVSWILNCAIVGGARDQLLRNAVVLDI